MNTMLRWSPTRQFPFYYDADDLAQRFFGGGTDEAAQHPSWVPAAEGRMEDGTYVIQLALPGVDPKEIQVSVDDNMLTLSGEKRYEKDEKDEKHYRMERSMGTFTRSVQLPLPVDATNVTAVFKHGLLTIRLPKTKAVKGASIPVKIE